MSTTKTKNSKASINNKFFVLPLRDVVVYPNMVIPLFVGRKKSIAALELALIDLKEGEDRKILLVAQKKSKVEDPKKEDLFEFGCLATILQLLKLPDGTVKLLVEGSSRVQVLSYVEEKSCFKAIIKYPKEKGIDKKVKDVLLRTLLTQFETFLKLNKKIPAEIMTTLAGIDDDSRLSDTIAANMPLKLQEKQEILSELNIENRIEKLLVYMENELNLLNVEKTIRKRVKKSMEKSQKEYYLNEQMRAIQKELGEEGASELDEYEKKLKSSGMPKEALKKVASELNKLKLMPAMSAEATVSRNYIDWVLNVPWKNKSKLFKSLPKAESVLEADHYGLDKVKERILEYLAVQQRVSTQKGAILCLVGPPGVGKTSLGESIARATNRSFVRMSLGGVRDEAEIRGHRRTYIGSMPGKIIQKISKAKVKNPLFLLDEIDKMAMDFRGDPASALLEVLDPEQNNNFNDHYLELDYDLSDVMFIATANSTAEVPLPLLDRMEVIWLSGYTEEEKVNIAKKYLIAKQKEYNGLNDKEIKFSDEAVLDIIRFYTKEAGVRGLDREISKICRKVVKEILLTDGKAPLVIDKSNLNDYLGVTKFRYGIVEEEPQVGQVMGLAWTEVGGEVLTIESSAVAGKGKTLSTGHLGNVMKESIQAAITVVRKRAKLLGIEDSFYEKKDIHIHVPEGATPKDGPSAGVGMCVSLVSTLTNIPVRADVAMTGEITLRGEVLPIGGLKEKLLAAHRAGTKIVIIPEENAKDLKEIPDNILKSLEVKPVRWIEDALDISLVEPLKKNSNHEKGKKVKINNVSGINLTKDEPSKRH